MQCGFRSVSRRPQGNLSEFAVALLVFFLFAMFPLINIVMFAANAGTAAMITRNAANTAATSATYGDALAAVQTSVNNDLYVVATPLAGGPTHTYGPDTMLPTASDTTNYIYEYKAVSSFTLQPFVNLGSVPFIGMVPVVGASTPFSSTAERSVEDASGLNSLGNGAGATGGSSSTGTRSTGPSGGPPS